MAVNQSYITPDVLAQLFSDCTSSNVDVIREAEKRLSVATGDTQFIPSLLHLLSTKSSSVPPVLRQMAAIYVKNYVKKYWDVLENCKEIRSSDRTLIKDQIVHIAVQAGDEPNVYSQLSTVIRLISGVDFPDEWPSLLPHLVHVFTSSTDTLSTSRTIALELMDQVLQRYQHQNRTNDVLKQLKFDVLPIVQEFIVIQFTQLINTLFQSSSSGNIASEKVAMTQLLSCIRILQSLISIDLPEYIEDHQEELFKGCNLFLKFQSQVPSAANGPHDESPGILENVKSEICKFFSVYALRYSEEFEPFCVPCTTEIVNLLILSSSKNSQHSVYDNVIIASMNYLSAIARYNWNPCPLSGCPQRLADICHFLIVPNFQQRDEDIELMKDNPQDFIRRHVEETETDTRRGAAIELVHALMQRFEAQVSPLLVEYVTKLLKEAHTAPPGSLQSQRLQDAAICLVIALVVKTQSHMFGVSAVHQSVNLPDFFKHIANEIVVPRDTKILNNVLIRCSTLKFITTMRNQLDKSTVYNALPEIAKNLTVPDPLVHTYAALCIESMLVARDLPANSNVSSTTVTISSCPLKFTPEEISAILLPALDSVFQLVQTDVGIQDNEYLMRVIMKILSFLHNTVSIALPTLKVLLTILRGQCSHSVNPFFVHYLFESIALCTKMAASGGLHNDAEHMSLELLLSIIRDPDHDFTPYALQMMGLLLDTATTASPMYAQLIDHLLDTAQWASTARVLAIIRVFSAVLRKYPIFEVYLNQRLETLMLRFQYCLNHKRLCGASFDFLNEIISYVPIQCLTPYIQALVATLLRRLNEGKSTKMSRSVVFSLALLTCRSTVVFLPSVLDTIQTNLATDFLGNVFLSAWDTTDTYYTKKIGLLSVAKLCTTPQVANNPHLLQRSIELIAQFMGAVSSMDIARTKVATVDEGLRSSAKFLYDKPAGEFQSSFHSLHNAQVAATSKEISEVSIEHFRNNVGQCFRNPLVEANAARYAAWSNIMELLSSS